MVSTWWLPTLLLLCCLFQLIYGAEWRCEIEYVQPTGQANVGYGVDEAVSSVEDHEPVYPQGYERFLPGTSYNCSLFSEDNCPIEGKRIVKCCSNSPGNEGVCDEVEDRECIDGSSKPSLYCRTGSWYCGPAPTSTYDKDWPLWGTDSCDTCPFPNGEVQILCSVAKYTPQEFANYFNDGTPFNLQRFLASTATFSRCKEEMPSTTCRPGQPDIKGFIIDGLWRNQIQLDQNRRIYPRKLYANQLGGASKYITHGLPPGTFIDSDTGQLKGMPTEAGEFMANVTAWNIDGTDTYFLKVTVHFQMSAEIIILIVLGVLFACIVGVVFIFRYKRSLEKKLLKDNISVREGFTEKAVGKSDHHRDDDDPEHSYSGVSLEDIMHDPVDLHLTVTQPETPERERADIDDDVPMLADTEFGGPGRKIPVKTPVKATIIGNIKGATDVRGIDVMADLEAGITPASNGDFGRIEDEDENAVNETVTIHQVDDGRNILVVTPSAFALPPDHPRAGIGNRTDDGDPNVNVREILNRDKEEKKSTFQGIQRKKPTLAGHVDLGVAKLSQQERVERELNPLSDLPDYTPATRELKHRPSSHEFNDDLPDFTNASSTEHTADDMAPGDEPDVTTTGSQKENKIMSIDNVEKLEDLRSVISPDEAVQRFDGIMASPLGRKGKGGRQQLAPLKTPQGNANKLPKLDTSFNASDLNF